MSRAAFFRQSGWMLVATVGGGVFMFAVHPVMMRELSDIPVAALRDWMVRVIKPPLDTGAYGLFAALLPFITLLGMPSGGLQGVFTQQAAASTTEASERQLRRSVRVVLAWTFVIWLCSALLVVVFQKQFLGGLKIRESMALWLTLLTGLVVLWTPVLAGVLQGRQNFLWLGWSSILSGFGRCAALFILIRVLGGGITSAMLGVFLGAATSFVICAWHSRSVWLGEQERFAWRAWLARVVPLTLGLAATNFVMNADAIVVRARFPEESTGFYGAAAIIGRALIFFTAPMAAVMFPKIVQSAARAERTDVMALALGATALLGAGAAMFCTFFPGLPLKVAFGPSMLSIKELVPWFAWCMLPLTLTNVLINNLLARERFQVVPWLLGVAVAYGCVLLLVANHLSLTDILASFKSVVRIIGMFSLLLLLISAWFTWRTTEHRRRPGASTTAAAA